MATNTRDFHLRFIANMDLGTFKKSLDSMQGSIEKLKITGSLKNEFDTLFKNLTKELNNFTTLTNQEFNSLSDVKKLESSQKTILSLYNTLQGKIDHINTTKLNPIFTDEQEQRLEEINKLLEENRKKVESANSSYTTLRQQVSGIDFGDTKINKAVLDLINAAEKGKDYSDILSRITIRVNETKKAHGDFGEKIKKNASEIENNNKTIKDSETLIKNLNNQAKNLSVKDFAPDQQSLDTLKKKLEEAEQAAESFKKTWNEENPGKTLNQYSKLSSDPNTTYSDLKQNIQKAKAELDTFSKTEGQKKYNDELTRLNTLIEKTLTQVEQLKTKNEELQKINEGLINQQKQLDTKRITEIVEKLEKAKGSTEETQKVIQEFIEELTQINAAGVEKASKEFEGLKEKAGKSKETVNEVGEKVAGFGKQAEEVNKVSQQFEELYRKATYFFSINNAFNLFKKTIREAYNEIKELDAAMTDIAVVTDFNIGDVWETIPQYTDLSNELGTTILGAYETAKLYYQQGLDNNEVMEASRETLKMARIANMDYAEATDYMTAAVRGFKLEMTDASRVNDVFSKLAAISASDTQEIADALTRTASIANSAGMSLETTSAFLTQMIETTREAPENLGTALKTIIARFQEMKKAPEDVEVDGEIVNVNKVEAALKTIGVSLRDTQGQFRELDQVFLDISKKWNDLDINTQRYIATTAAGSRQQSRFIAMMDNYDRTVELVDAAYNSAGASQEQYEKTLDSLQSKLNMLSNAWHEFITGIANSSLIKGSVDLLTKILTVVNNLTDKFGEFGNSIAKVGVLLGGLSIGNKAVTAIGNKFFPKLMETISGWTGNTGSATKSGEFLGTELLRGITNSINKDKTLASSLSDKFEGFIDSFKRKGDSFKNAFSSFSSSIKSSYLEAGDISEQKEFLKVINELTDAENQYYNNLNEVNDATKKGLAIAQRYNDAQNALNNSKIISTIYQKLSNTEQLAYNSLIKIGINTKQADLLMTNEQTKAAILRAAAEGKLNKELLEQIAAESGLFEGKTKLGSKIKNYTKLLFGSSKATRQAAAETLGMTKAAANGTTSLSALGSAASAVSLGWIALAVAVAAATAALIAYGVYINSIEYKTKQAAKFTENAKEEAEELKQVYQDLFSKKEEYDNSINAIEDLTEGTKAWKDAIIEANDKTLELVSNYKDLAQYVSKDKNGLLTISDEGWDNFLKKSEKASSDALNRVFVSQINESQLNDQLVTKNTNKKLEKSLRDLSFKVELPDNINSGDTSLEKAQKILDNWSEFTEKNNDIYSVSELNSIKTDLLSTVEEYNTSLYNSSEQVSSYFTLLADSLGIACENVDNFAESLGFFKPDASIAETYNLLRPLLHWGERFTNIGSYTDPEKVTYDERAGVEARNTLRQIADSKGIIYDDSIDLDKLIYEIYAKIVGYEDYTDVKALIDKGDLKFDDLMETIAEDWIVNQQKVQTENLAKYYDSLDKETANFINNILSNNTEELLKSQNVKDLNQIITNGQVDKTALETYLGGKGTSLDNLAEAYNRTPDEIVTVFDDFIKQLQDLTRTNAKKLLTTYSKTGALNGASKETLQNILTTLQPEKIQELNTLIDTLNSGLGEGTDLFNSAANQLLSLYVNGTEEDITAVKKIVEGINWNSTIDSAYQLEQALNSNNEAVKTFAANMLLASKQEYSISNQFKELYQSEGYTSLTEDIKDLIKENDKLTAENVEELAEKNEDLNKILKQNIVTASTFAKVLTGLEKGTLSIEGLTNRTFDFLNSLSSVNSLIDKVHNNIEKFDEGIDTGEGVDFLKGLSDKVKEYGDAFEYGNEQAVKALEYVFGDNIFDGLSGEQYEEAFKQYSKKLEEWTAGDGYGFWQDVANGIIDIPGIKASLDENKNIVLDIADMTTDEIVEAMAKDNKMSEEAAGMLLTGFISHSADLRQALKENDTKAAIENLFTSDKSFRGENNLWVYSREEFENMAAAVDMSYEDFLAKAKSYNNSISIAEWFTDDDIPKLGDKLKAELDKVYNGLGSKSTKEKLNYLGVNYELNDYRNTNQQFNGILVNLDELIAKYQELGLTIEQAYDEIDRMAAEKTDEEENLKFTATVAIGVDEEGKTITDTVYADTREGLELAIEQVKSSEKMKQWATTFAESIKLAFEEDSLSINFAETTDDAVAKVEEARSAAQKFLDENLNIIKYKNDLSNVEKELNNFIKKNRTITLGYNFISNNPMGSRPVDAADAATKYPSRASGTNNNGVPKTGPALTGEEGYEIAYNNGEAYLLGANGPEIVNLEKGTKIFNHKQSKAIINRSKIKGFGGSFANGTIGSYASKKVTGQYNQEAKDEANKVKGNSSSSSKSSSDKDPYESALDIYHNFIVALSKLNNDLEDLINERDRILSKESRALEAGDVEAVANAQKELEEINDRILKQQQKIVKENSDYISSLKYGLNVLENRFSEYNSVVDTSNGYINVNWETYNNLDDTGKETVDDLISEWEDYNDRIEEAKDGIQEIIDYYYDLAEEYRDMHDEARDSFIDLINDLTDVLIEIDEKALERQQEYYDQLIEQDEDYLDALRKNVEERRKIRDRENSYEDLAEKQRRLSLLKRDTSGVYKNEIASLEKEIANSQQDLTDQKIDDIIENMEEDLDLRKEQFDKHIELMEDSINQAKENGEYARRAQELLEQQPEEAYRILTESNSEYLAMSSAEQAQYVEEIKNQMIEMSRFMEGYYLRLAESMDAVAEAIKVQLSNALAALGQNSSNINSSQIGAGAGPNNSGSSSSGDSSGGSSIGNPNNPSTKETIKEVQRAINRIMAQYNSQMSALGKSNLRKEYLTVDGITGPKTRSASLQMINWATSKGVSASDVKLIQSNRSLIGFKKGGIVDFTGPAMVHGSKSKPESFLDAEDTKNIASLRDFLRELNLSNRPNLNYGTSNFRAGDCTIYINVDQIASDYDIDRAIEEVQRKILSSSSYRNINLINRMR